MRTAAPHELHFALRPAASTGARSCLEHCGQAKRMCWAGVTSISQKRLDSEHYVSRSIVNILSLSGIRQFWRSARSFQIEFISLRGSLRK